MQTEPIGFDNDDISFIENALNFYWNNAHTSLLRKDLGDIEKRNYEYQLSMSKQLMQRIEQNSKQFTASKKMAIALQYVKNRIHESENWWMDCPDKGGFDIDIIDNALKEAGL